MDVAIARNLILCVAQAVAGGTSHGPFGLASACPWFWRGVWEYLAGRATQHNQGWPLRCRFYWKCIAENELASLGLECAYRIPMKPEKHCTTDH